MRRGGTGLGGKTSEPLSWVAGTPGKIRYNFLGEKKKICCLGITATDQQLMKRGKGGRDLIKESEDNEFNILNSVCKKL